MKLDQPFAVIGDHPAYSSIRSPPGHPHCQCTMVPVLDIDEQPHWAETLIQPQAEEPKPEPIDVPPLPPKVAKPKPAAKPRPAAKPVLPVQPAFQPAATIEEAEEWVRSQGITPLWRTPGEPDDKYKITLTDINGAHEALHELSKIYPEVKPTIDQIGTFTAIDRTKWLTNYALHIEEDRAKFEAAGRRWRQSEADKRVRKVMVSEPTFTHDDTGVEYSIFKAAHWNAGKNWIRPKDRTIRNRISINAAS